MNWRTPAAARILPLNTNDLHTLMQVVRQGSFAGAARALTVDPSSVSRAVAALEDELGIRIFQRSTRRLRLTESGTVFVDRISGVLEDLEEARQAAADASGDIRGKLRVTMPHTFGLECLVPILPDFCRSHPALELDLVFNDALVDLVAEGIDIALRLAPLRDSTLVAVPILDIRYLVVASPHWLQVNGGHAPEPRELEAVPCLCLALPGRERWIFHRPGLPEPLGVQVRQSVLASNATALRELAAAGLGPALLADWLVAGEVAAGRLVELFPEYEVTVKDAPRKAWAVYPTRSHVPAKVRLFVDFMRHALAPDAGTG